MAECHNDPRVVNTDLANMGTALLGPPHDVPRFLIGKVPFGQEHGAECAAYVVQVPQALSAVLLDVRDIGSVAYAVEAAPQPVAARCSNHAGDQDGVDAFRAVVRAQPGPAFSSLGAVE